MNRTKKMILTMIFAMCMIFCIGNQADAAKKKKFLSLEAKRVEANQVTLSWTDMNDSSYVIYRRTAKSNGSYGKETKIATVVAGKTTYVDSTVKKGKKYEYNIVGIDKNGKEKKDHTSDCTVCIKMIKPYWADEEECCMYDNTKSYIALHVFYENGITPDGYEIYRRKTGTKSWKKIKTIKKRSVSVNYKDKTVKAGQCYQYRVKAYWKNKGKKVYKNTTIDTRYAVNDKKHSKFSVSVLTPDNTKADTIDLKLTSDKNNGKLVIDNASAGLETYLTYKTQEYKSIEDSVVLRLSAYSTDGENWIEIGEKDKIELLPGGQLFLRLQVYDVEKKQGTTMHFSTSDMKSFSCRLVPIKYSDIIYQWSIDIKNQTAEIDCSEYTH